jgi:alpha-tubulin suppressor-like RCC1 family protein
MLQYFSKIDYGFTGGTFTDRQFGGGTFTVLNIFKNVQLTANSILFTETKIDDERPDQFSNRIYQNSNYYWATFLTNNIRNPLVEWGGTDPEQDSKLEKQYPGLVYQFGNVSKYNPTITTDPYQDYRFNPYTGTDINSDIPDRIDPTNKYQILVFETGSGEQALRAFGAGQVLRDSSTSQPHHKQSVIPVSTGLTAIQQISCGSFNTAVLTTSGQIYYWGGNPLPMTTNIIYGTYGSASPYFTTSISGCSYINSTNSGLLALTSNGGITCFGGCTAFNLLYTGTTGYTKVSWNDGFTAGVAIKSNGTPTYFGSLTTPSGISFYDIACGQSDCIAINRTTNYGVTGWGPNKNSLFAGFDQGITGITAIALGYNHFLALKDNGIIYGGGATEDGQLQIPTGVTFSKISAGRYHSAAITTDGNLLVWGKIAKTYQNTSPVINLEKVTPTPIVGKFLLLGSGAEHVVVMETGDNKKYTAVIDSVDMNFKRINVKAYNYPEILPEALGQTAEIDPSGTRVSVWDFNNGIYTKTYEIQHQFMTIQRYLDSTKQIIVGGNLYDPAVDNNWKDIYLTGYTNADSTEFLTVKKDAIEQQKYEDAKLNILNLSNVLSLQTILSAQLPVKDQIKITI